MASVSESNTSHVCLKLVTVGTGQAGKTVLLIAYTTKTYPAEYVPTIFDNYGVHRKALGKNCVLCLWDTLGRLDDYDRLRPLSYPQTDVFLVCFDIANRNSFEQTREKWIPELDHHQGETPRILVGCKGDLRASLGADECVSVEEAREMAVELKCYQYMETSSLNMEGLEDLFQTALKLGLVYNETITAEKKKLFYKRRKWKCGDGPMEIYVPPELISADPMPEILVEGRTIEEGGLDLLQTGSCADTILILSDGQEMLTHRIVLVSASTVFRKVLAESNKTDSQFQHPAILRVDSSDAPRSTRIYLTDVVKPQVLKHALEFFYAGTMVLDGIPSTSVLNSIRKFGEMFGVHFLRKFGENVANHDEDLNPSVGEYFTDFVGQKMKELFFDKEQDADVKFVFPDREVFAHKCILSARNTTMAAMFDGRFMEGNKEQITPIDMRKDNQTEPDTFLVMLEYLYTGHAPLDKRVDPVSLLILSDRYNITRLTNLCELYITELVDTKWSKNIEETEIDVIGLLNTANVYNAPQLTKWCLYFISTNYTTFSTRPEWNQLSSEDLQHIEEHRWPPLDYLHQVQEYKEQQQKLEMKSAACSSKKSCRLM